MKLGEDNTPSGINSLMQTNIKQMTFETELPEFVQNPQLWKNNKFKRKLISHTLERVYGCGSVHEIEYKRKLNALMIGIGKWRSDTGQSSGTKFTNPETREEVNCFDFAAKYVETPKTHFKDMETEERDARIKYLWKKLRLIVRTKGFLYQIVHDRTMRKIDMCALDTLESDEEYALGQD